MNLKSPKKLKTTETKPACEVLWSQPNPEQTDQLRIGFQPLPALQNEQCYPIVMMPQPNAFLKLPRKGRSDVVGYLEDDFLAALYQAQLGVEMDTNCHMVIPDSYRPYEPAIVLCDKSLNLFIDVEIDEPYDGYSRLITHASDGHDDIRNRFFCESGWVVVRFSEHQIHNDSHNCIAFLKSLIASLKSERISIESSPRPEQRWTTRQAMEWERDLYREKDLGIQSFDPVIRHHKVLCQPENEPIEIQIKRTAIHPRLDPEMSVTQPIQTHPAISFDDPSHVYFPTHNLSGDADYVSVTTLIDGFFPSFDQEKYILQKIKDTGMSRQEIEAELNAPSEQGTEMHKNIELFLKGETVQSDSKEFALFMRFYHDMIQSRGLRFFAAEMNIQLPQHHIAGTVDALFQRPNGDFVMIDWKRSTHLIINGQPRKYGFGHGLSVLSRLDNSSYYKYELQQSFYKYILKTEYDIDVKHMILAVLHPHYDTYYDILLDDYREKEVLDMIEANDLIHK